MYKTVILANRLRSKATKFHGVALVNSPSTSIIPVNTKLLLIQTASFKHTINIVTEVKLAWTISTNVGSVAFKERHRKPRHQNLVGNLMKSSGIISNAAVI
jgi:hypothetical protein